MSTSYLESHPDENGYFGKIWRFIYSTDVGRAVCTNSRSIQGVEKNHLHLLKNLSMLEKHYQGRPTPISYAKKTLLNFVVERRFT